MPHRCEGLSGQNGIDLFFQVPERSRWLNSTKDNFSSSRYNHSCLRTALIGCFHFLTLRRKKRFKVNSLSQHLQMWQLAGSQPWRRLFSGKRPKISNHTVFNHHFIYISSLPKVKRGTRRSTSRSESPQIPLRNLFVVLLLPPSLSHVRAPPDWQSHFNLFTPAEPLPLPRSPTCASSGSVCQDS